MAGGGTHAHPYRIRGGRVHTLTLWVVRRVLDRADEDLQHIALFEHGTVAGLAAVKDVVVCRITDHHQPRAAPAHLVRELSH